MNRPDTSGKSPDGRTPGAINNDGRKTLAVRLDRPTDRPGPQPHNAGLTARWQHLVNADEPVTRGDLRVAVLPLRRKISRLQRQVAALTAALAGRSESTHTTPADRPDHTARAGE